MTIYTASKIIKQSLGVLVLCTLLEVFGGSIIHSKLETLITLPIILAMFPVINGVGGNIGSIISMRLTSGLHTGMIELSIRDKELFKNIVGAGVLGVASFSTLTVIILLLAPYIGLEFPMALFWKLVITMLLSGILLTCVVVIVSIVSAFFSFKRGIDPDNTVTPLVTTSGDIVGIFFLILMISLVGI